MGYDIARIEISFRVSRHNDERDRRDDAAAEQLRKEIEALLTTPEYVCLEAMVWGP